MAEGGQRGDADVVDARGEAAVEERADLGGEDAGLSAARRRAEPNEALHHLGSVGAVGVRRLEEANRIVLDVARGGDLADEALHPENVFALQDRSDLRGGARGRAIHDRVELFAPRERDVELEEEAIELRLGQRIRALTLERVLRREDHERFFEDVGSPRDGDGVLLHRLEERALRLRRRAVDLVREHDVREDRAFAKLELLPAPGRVGDHRRPEDVGRHEIGGELDARELERQGLCEGADEESLAEAGHPLEERVRSDEHARERSVDDVAIADDHLRDLFAQEADVLGEPGDVFFVGGFAHRLSLRHSRGRISWK